MAAAIKSSLGSSPARVVLFMTQTDVSTSHVDEPIGEILLDIGVLSESDLSRARLAQAKSGGHLGDILRKLGLISDEDWARALAAKAGLRLIGPSEFPTSAFLRNGISDGFLKDRCLLPLGITNGKLRLAMADPEDRYAIEAIALAAGTGVEPVSLRSGTSAKGWSAFTSRMSLRSPTSLASWICLATRWTMMSSA